MTPQELIAIKKSEFAVSNSNELFFDSDLFKEELKDGKDVEKLKEEIKNTDYAVYLFEQNRNRFPSYVNQMYDSGSFAIGEIDNPIPNAHFYNLGDLNYAITFNAGLKNFIYRVIRAYSTRFVFTEDENKKSSISFEETCQKIADIFWWFGISQGQAYGPNYPITKDQIKMANILTMEAELFFVAHEVGHLNYDMMSNSPMADKYKENYGHLSEEFEADRFALLTCLGAFDESGNHKAERNDVIYAGCELALLIFSGLEKIGFEIEKWHPPANERIEHIRLCLKQNCASENDYVGLTKFSEGTTTIYNMVIDLITQPSDKQEEFYSQKANEVIQQIDFLLDKHSNGMVPNYSQFYIDMEPVFASGYHHKFIDKILEVGQSFFDDIKKSKENSGSMDDMSIKKFFKFKLLLGFSDYLAEPAKSLFKEKLFSTKPNE